MEAQGFHSNNSQATLHSFAVYYTESGKLHQLSYVIISDCIVSNMIRLLFMFLKCLVEFLTDEFNCCPHKIINFLMEQLHNTSQKNFLNLCHNKADFGIDAEWHFFATSHGKGLV